MNPFKQLQQLGNIFKGIKNPQQAVLQLLENNSNPMAKQVLEMAKNGKYGEIEKFARNVCKEKNVDFDKEISKFKNNIGI